MSTQVRVALLIAGAFVIAIGGLLFWSGRDDAAEPGSAAPSGAADPRLVREDSLLNYMLFVGFFPQLIAGPIVHHQEIMPQFLKPGFRGADAAMMAAESSPPGLVAK